MVKSMRCYESSSMTYRLSSQTGSFMHLGQNQDICSSSSGPSGNLKSNCVDIHSTCDQCLQSLHWMVFPSDSEPSSTLPHPTQSISQGELLHGGPVPSIPLGAGNGSSGGGLIPRAGRGSMLPANELSTGGVAGAVPGGNCGGRSSSGTPRGESLCEL
jgi:hypothetical protein